MNGALKIQLTQNVSIHGPQPLYSRVPTYDDNGKYLSDFIVLVSGLRTWPGGRQTDTVTKMQDVLSSFAEVVFADLNVPLNLLWVSVKAKPGIIPEVYGALKQCIPEAVLVGPYLPPE